MGQIAEVEKIIKNYKGFVDESKKDKRNKNKKQVSYTSVRNMYNLTLNVMKNEYTKDDVEYLKMKIVYQLAKDADASYIKTFVNKTKILDKLDEIIECDEKEFNKKVKDFKIYMEAIIAYFKYYIGDK